MFLPQFCGYDVRSMPSQGQHLRGRVQNVMQGQDTNAVAKTKYEETLYLLTLDTKLIL